MVTSGEIAYCAYRAFLNVRPEKFELVEWKELDLWQRAAWEHAALEAISVHVAAALA